MSDALLAAPTAATPQSEPGPLAALVKAATLRNSAWAIADRISRIQHLPALHLAHGKAIAGLAGLRLHRIAGHANEDDAHAIAGDLKALWEILDPLILAIGQELNANFAGVDLKDFTNPLQDALDGNATFQCEQAIERLVEDEGDDAPSIDPNREHIPVRI